jgi:small subunit ribosomal protein S18
MARSNDRERSTRRSPKDTARRGKKKVCIFCKEHIDWVDYKDVSLLRKFMSERGKIRARRVSGNCAQHQRDVAVAIKTARELALLPYTQRTTTDRPGPRSGGRPGRGAPEAAEGALEAEGIEGIELEDLDVEGIEVADEDVVGVGVEDEA